MHGPLGCVSSELNISKAPQQSKATRRFTHVNMAEARAVQFLTSINLQSTSFSPASQLSLPANRRFIQGAKTLVSHHHIPSCFTPSYSIISLTTCSRLPNPINPINPINPSIHPAPSILAPPQSFMPIQYTLWIVLTYPMVLSFTFWQKERIQGTC